MILLNKELVQD